MSVRLTKILILVIMFILLTRISYAEQAGLNELIDATQAISSGDVARAQEMFAQAAEKLPAGEMKQRAQLMETLLDNIQPETYKNKIIDKSDWFFIGEKNYEGTSIHLYYDTKGNNVMHSRFSGVVDLDDYVNEVGGENFKKGKTTRSSSGYVSTQQSQGVVVDMRIWACKSTTSSWKIYTEVNSMTSVFSEEDYSKEFFMELDGCPQGQPFAFNWIYLLIGAIIVVVLLIVVKKRKK